MSFWKKKTVFHPDGFSFSRKMMESSATTLTHYAVVRSGKENSFKPKFTSLPRRLSSLRKVSATSPPPNYLTAGPELTGIDVSASFLNHLLTFISSQLQWCHTLSLAPGLLLLWWSVWLQPCLIWAEAWSVNSDASRSREFLCSHSSALFVALCRSKLATAAEEAGREVRTKGKKKGLDDQKQRNKGRKGGMREIEKRFLNHLLLAERQEWNRFERESSSWERNWVAVLKACTPLRLKPHCFSSTRWYFLSVGALGGCWVEHRGNASASPSSTAADSRQHMELPLPLSACQPREARDTLQRKSPLVVRSWRAEGCAGRLE